MDASPPAMHICVVVWREKVEEEVVVVREFSGDASTTPRQEQNSGAKPNAYPSRDRIKVQREDTPS